MYQDGVVWKSIVTNPNDEVVRQIKLVKSRICGTFSCMVQQKYDKLTILKGLK